VDTHLRVKRFLQTNEFSCIVRSHRKVDNKIITRKIRNESISFQNEYMVIFVVQYTTMWIISWFRFMHQLNGRIFV